MIEGGEYHDSSEELFTLQNIVEWYPLSISDSKSPQTWPNRDVFLFFGFTHLCAFIKVALIYESDWRTLFSETKKATKIFQIT